MSQYEKYNQRTRSTKKPWTVHPIWRGIGCFMMILIPVMSYAGAVLLVDENYRQGWLPMPRELARTIEIPMLGGVPNLLAYLMVTLVLCLIGFGVFVTLYSFVYRLFEPTHLGPLDAEPVTRAERRAYARRQAAVYKKHK